MYVVIIENNSAMLLYLIFEIESSKTNIKYICVFD